MSDRQVQHGGLYSALTPRIHVADTHLVQLALPEGKGERRERSSDQREGALTNALGNVYVVLIQELRGAHSFLPPNPAVVSQTTSANGPSRLAVAL